jgi:hypothetical protein
MFKGTSVAGIRRAAIVTASTITLGVGAAVWATSAASAAPAAPPACTAADLAVWVNASEANGAAGTIGYPLEFTNISKTACVTEGYPGVSALGAKGQQLGSAAGRDPTYRPARVTIPAGGTAHAELEWADVTNYAASSCKPASASLIKVYPPNQKGYDLGFVSLLACGAKGDPYLQTGVIQPGPNAG